MSATYWNGAKVICDWCKSELVESKGDVDHDDGVCEVFHCLTCGHQWHDELPD